ncbi:MAG: tRNA (guanosine(37)-N1)-methyltransferase TrmD [Candidatus Omnitrophica bacterium CG11_big_fil_rev_8_21_14_0_20_64_10]|nr:MAG: tRNA (guanosine(37)-N1)-methyltransferase TrmD [Candidatus Omnitrophica bacterium CG11_big_fil_rev_8_21_14_0_20_64_10]
MRIDILTIFPKLFPPVLGESILGRAQRAGVVSLGVWDLRVWSEDQKHRKVDDRPYGGGPGMVMRPEPFFKGVAALKRRGQGRRSGHKTPDTGHRTPGVGRRRPRVILLSPQGERLTQKLAGRLAGESWLILLCGHYEGVDERVRAGLADQVVSIGDYILTGGELPAMVLVDSIVRLLPGSLGDDRSAEEESFVGGLLEYPQYTRPVEYRGMRVPSVLRSGDFSEIQKWRRLQAFRRTAALRPDLDGPKNSGD